jgi:hypothetical protein
MKADMCEIIRAGIAAGNFSEVTDTLENIPIKLIGFKLVI